MNILLDTRIVLDYLQAREPFFNDALNIFIGAANHEYNCFITASSMTDLYYIIHKHTHNDADTRYYLSQLLQLVGILDTSAEDCTNALHSVITDYEDAVMTETAFRSHIDLIITRNVSDYSDSRVPVSDPAVFLMSLS